MSKLAEQIKKRKGRGKSKDNETSNNSILGEHSATPNPPDTQPANDRSRTQIGARIMSKRSSTNSLYDEYSESPTKRSALPPPPIPEQ